MSSLSLGIHFKKAIKQYHEYEICVEDLLKNEQIQSMAEFTHHSNVSCLDHSLHVSFITYRVCRRLGLDYRSAARGALLHDFFLYDRHVHQTGRGLPRFVHPQIAFENAQEITSLNEIEKDIILKHMWPLTFKLPRHKEAMIVIWIDKYCTILEMIKRSPA